MSDLKFQTFLKLFNPKQTSDEEQSKLNLFPRQTINDGSETDYHDYIYNYTHSKSFVFIIRTQPHRFSTLFITTPAAAAASASPFIASVDNIVFNILLLSCACVSMAKRDDLIWDTSLFMWARWASAIKKLPFKFSQLIAGAYRI